MSEKKRTKKKKKNLGFFPYPNLRARLKIQNENERYSTIIIRINISQYPKFIIHFAKCAKKKNVRNQI